MFRYTLGSIVAEYARSVIGLAVTLGPLALLEPPAWLSVILAVCAALFLVYAARSVARHSLQIVLDESGIEARGLFGVAIAWEALRSVEVNYYTTHRDGRNGWTELVVRSASSKIRIESTLQGFPGIAARVAREALQRDCQLDDRSRTNLAALGVDFGQEAEGNIDPSSRAGHA